MERPPNCDEEAMELPGFRFHPTDEELVSFYLRRRAEGRSKSFHYLIMELDIYKCDPWEIPGMAKFQDGQKEWYFFCPRDKKYKNSNRPNRVTKSGFWKATGTDKQIVAANCTGLKKSLVFYTGKASKGQKTDWMMHEFRLPNAENGHEEPSWAICKIFKRKASTNHFASSTCAIQGSMWPVMSNLDKPMPSLIIPTDHDLDLDHDNECNSFASEDDSKSQNSPFPIIQTNDHVKTKQMLTDESTSQNNLLTPTSINNNIYNDQVLNGSQLQNTTARLPTSNIYNDQVLNGSQLQNTTARPTARPPTSMNSLLSRTNDVRLSQLRLLESMETSTVESPKSSVDDKATFKDKKPSKLKLNQSSNKGTIVASSIPLLRFRSPLITPLLDDKSLNYHKTLFQSWGGDESKAFIESYSQEALPLSTPESFIHSSWSPQPISLWGGQNSDYFNLSGK